MARCPVCRSDRLDTVVKLSREVVCSRCGTRWIEDGVYQIAVHRLDASPPNIASISVHSARPSISLAR